MNNLAWDVGWQDLKSHFRRGSGGAALFDVRRAEVLQDHATGRSKGCGVVELATPADAARALAVLQGSLLKGRALFLRGDREDYALGGAGQGCRVYVGNLSWRVGWQDLKDHIVRCLGAYPGLRIKRVEIPTEPRPPEWDEDSVDDHDHHDHEDEGDDHNNSETQETAGAGGEGELHQHRQGRRKKKRQGWNKRGRSLGYGLVTFESAADATRAIVELNDTELKGRLIFLREDREAEAAAAVAFFGQLSTQPLGARPIGGQSSNGGRGNGGHGNGSGLEGGQPWLTGRIGGNSVATHQHHYHQYFQPYQQYEQYEYPQQHQQQLQQHQYEQYQYQYQQQQYHHYSSGVQHTTFRPPLVSAAFGATEPAATHGPSGCGVGVGVVGRQCFVGNLSPATTWRALKDHIQRHMPSGGSGLERVEVLMFPNGESRRCGTARFASSALATQAILHLKDTVLDGLCLTVREDRQAAGR